MNKKILLLVFLFCMTIGLFAQRPENQQLIEDLIEQIASGSDDELDYTTLFDDLNYYLSNPLNINEAEREDLEKLQILSEYQINNFFKHRLKYGNFLTIYELMSVEGFNKEMLILLEPFIDVENVKKEKYKLNARSITKYGKHQLFLRTKFYLEEQKGYSAINDSDLYDSPNSRYMGDKYKIYTRYKYNYKNKLYWGFTAEKDPGEVFIKNNVNDSIQNLAGSKLKNGFDFYSAHFQINDIGPVKKLAVGDYQMQFGQGLTFWSGMGFGKSPYAMNINKNARGIRKYSSTNENLFLRGVGTTVEYKNLDLSVFYSSKKSDANISSVDTLDKEIVEVSSLQNTGIHATPSQLEDKQSIGQKIMGGNLNYRSKFFKLGFTSVFSELEAPLYKRDAAYNFFEFSGKNSSCYGLDYKVNYKNLSAFGEVALSDNLAYAFTNGAVINLSSQVGFAVLHRHFEKDFQSIYGNSFSEGTKVSNEDGLYLGIEMYPLKNWKLSAYYDTYKFPWLKYGVDAPSSGYDYFVQADYTPTRRFNMYCRIKQEVKKDNQTDTDEKINQIVDENKLQFRYDMRYEVSKNVRLKNRVQLTKYNKGDSPSENGYMVYQDVKYAFSKLPITFNYRFALFDTDSWNTRIYAYENDVLYAFSIPAYYSKGYRTYLLMKYSIFKNVDFWIRYSVTKFTDKETVGTGLTEIDGSKRSEIKVQLRFKF